MEITDAFESAGDASTSRTAGDAGLGAKKSFLRDERAADGDDDNGNGQEQELPLLRRSCAGGVSGETVVEHEMEMEDDEDGKLGERVQQREIPDTDEVSPPSTMENLVVELEAGEKSGMREEIDEVRSLKDGDVERKAHAAEKGTRGELGELEGRETHDELAVTEHTTSVQDRSPAMDPTILFQAEYLGTESTNSVLSESLALDPGTSVQDHLPSVDPTTLHPEARPSTELTTSNPASQDPESITVVERFPIDKGKLQANEISPAPTPSTAPLSSLSNPNPLFEEAFACIDAVKDISAQSSNPFPLPDKAEMVFEPPSATNELDQVPFITPPSPNDLGPSAENSLPIEGVLFPQQSLVADNLPTAESSPPAQTPQNTKQPLPSEIPASDDEDAMDEDISYLPNFCESRAMRSSAPEDPDTLFTNVEPTERAVDHPPVSSSTIEVELPDDIRPTYSAAEDLELVDAPSLISVTSGSNGHDEKSTDGPQSVVALDVSPDAMAVDCAGPTADTNTNRDQMESSNASPPLPDGKSTLPDSNAEPTGVKSNKGPVLTASELGPLSSLSDEPEESKATTSISALAPAIPEGWPKWTTEEKLPAPKAELSAPKRGRASSREKSKGSATEDTSEMEIDANTDQLEPETQISLKNVDKKSHLVVAPPAQEPDVSIKPAARQDEGDAEAAIVTGGPKGKKRKASTALGTSKLLIEGLSGSSTSTNNAIVAQESEIPGSPAATSDKLQNKTTSKPVSSKAPPTSSSEDGAVLFAELKAMKISSIQARNASLEAEIAAKRAKLQEITQELQNPAAETVKRHIKLLHDYNDIRDVGQGLVGMIADNRGVRIGDLYDEFGVGLTD